jgi:polyisoprenoid-binding protein YceI
MTVTKSETMKRTLFVLAIAVMSISAASAQRYMTKTGKIRFYSDTPMEKIEAVNRQVNSALDVSSGSFVFRAMIKSFEFEKALMQEHFNENYMESDKFPLSSFTGKVSNLSEINFSKDGTYNAVVEGDLTIHGVTKKIKEKGTFEVKAGKVTGKSVFNVLLKDYNVAVPKAVTNNIAESIEVTVDVVLEKLN